MKSFQKNQAFKLKELLKENGHVIPLQTVQHLLAQSYGYENSHVFFKKKDEFNNAFSKLFSKEGEPQNNIKEVSERTPEESINKERLSILIVKKDSGKYAFRCKDFDEAEWMIRDCFINNRISKENLETVRVSCRGRLLKEYSYKNIMGNLLI